VTITTEGLLPLESEASVPPKALSHELDALTEDTVIMNLVR
jgi:hypothetical protein